MFLTEKNTAISLKGGKIGPTLPLMTNRKIHTRFPLVAKSMTLDDLERPFCDKFCFAPVLSSEAWLSKLGYS